MNKPLESGDRMVFLLMRCALACLLIAVVGGAVSVIFYFKAVAEIAGNIGIQFRNFRPIHTTFASCWIFLAGVACVFRYLHVEYGEMRHVERNRFRFQMICWGLAGAGILLTLPFGISSGREYLGFHPVFSILIVAGWLAFAWTFFSRVRRGFWSKPVYVYMWATGIVYFVYTFVEGHAYLIPWVRNYPVADLQIQWKHCGTVVASFNMLIYGSLMYIGECLSGDKSYARSSKGFAFMGIGLLNSFTNYAHHTYHIPQAAIIKWVAFVVSMLEVIILVSIFDDLRKSIAKRTPTDTFGLSTGFLDVARLWSFGLLVIALLISIPPLNSFIHGTHVVMAHAMGSEIGIDSFVLFGVFAFFLEITYERCWMTRKRLAAESMKTLIRRTHYSLLGLFGWLVAYGCVVAWTRAFSLPVPEAMATLNPPVLVFFGLLHGYFLLRIFGVMWPLLADPAKRLRDEQDVYPTEYYRQVASPRDAP